MNIVIIVIMILTQARADINSGLRCGRHCVAMISEGDLASFDTVQYCKLPVADAHMCIAGIP